MIPNRLAAPHLCQAVAEVGQAATSSKFLFSGKKKKARAGRTFCVFPAISRIAVLGFFHSGKLRWKLSGIND